jgi:hypothetical protein
MPPAGLYTINYSAAKKIKIQSPKRIQQQMGMLLRSPSGMVGLLH